jgi:bifunctional non-homologous end joining protein LigD
VRPDASDSVHEIKFGGYRMAAGLDRGKAKMPTRRRWTARFTTIAAAVASAFPAQSALDGEVAVLDDDGISNFATLQEALSEGQTGRMVYFAFDLLYLEGRDL